MINLENNNFFALFNLDVGFDIDKSHLKATLLELQKQHHPDKANNESDVILAQKNASLINHAYDVLLFDDSRAIYLLSLAGQEIDLEQSINDLNFLDEMMDIRMTLEDSDDLAIIHQLNDTVNQLNNQYAKDFKNAYGDQQWQSAKDTAQKLKFLAKLSHDIQEKLSNRQDDIQDDDLYV